MEVNGHKLPDYLVQLMQEGRWKRPEDTSGLQKIVGDAHSTIDFLTLEEMDGETKAGYRFLEEAISYGNQLPVVGQSSTKLQGSPITDPEILDVDLHVVIMADWGDDGICLDYRTGADSPRVIAYTEGCFISEKWKIIAPDFETFASIIGL
jgi:hypothetical protein